MALDLDEIRKDCRGLVYISDGTRGSNRVGAALGHIRPLIAEVEELQATVRRMDNVNISALRDAGVWDDNLGVVASIKAMAATIKEKNAEVERLREQAREAHDALVMAAAPMTWATDGRLHTGVHHATSYIEKLAAENVALEVSLNSMDHFAHVAQKVEARNNELEAEVEQLRAMVKMAWDEGHKHPQRRGPEGCRCSALSFGECGCGLYGTGELLSLDDNPYAGKGQA